MESIGWLHLTDLHQGQGSQRWLWPNVRDAFYKDIELLHNESGPWDLVFFTGDLTFSGKPEEYDEFNKTLENLWSRLKVLGSTPVLLPVPGNHDLSWRDSMSGSVRAIRQWHQDEGLRDHFWGTEDNEYRKLVLDAFASYMYWRESCDLVPRSDLNRGILPGDFSYTFQKGELKLGIVGLNSAFLQLTKDNYEGSLDLDVRQLNAVCKGDIPEWIREHDASFLMTHHPYSWLHPNGQQHFKAEIYIPDRFLIHLHGHMHEHASQSIRVGGSPAQRYLQGSSLFGLETWGDGTKKRQHGYSAGRISIEGDQGIIKIWPREAILTDAGYRKIVPYHKFDLDPGEEFTSETFKQSIKPAEPKPVVAQEPVKEKEPSSPGASYDLNNLVFSVPYQQKGDRVLGIEDTLKRVRGQLVSGHRTNIGQAVAFQGLGGLGKTQLAVEYAFRFKDEYPGGVIWINADQTIDAQLIEMVDQARLIAPESEHKVKLAVARQRLRTYSGSLIIFDNVDKLEDIEEYLDLLPSDVHILATSRIELGGFDPILLDTLDSDLSYRLLIQEANREPIPPREKEAAIDIVTALGGLPLAIELAGAYLRNRQAVGWHEYRDLLNYNPRDAFLKKSAATPYTRHKTDLYSTLRINEGLLKEEPRLREILDLLTWSGSAPMGKDLLGALIGVKNLSELTNALGLGLTLRLLQKTRDAESYSIHRLVREVRREDVPLKGKESWVSDTCKRLGDWFQHLRESFLDLPKFDAEIDHLKAWQQNAIDYAPEHASRLTWLQAYPPFYRSRYSEALELINRAFELYEKVDDLELKAHLLNDLAFIQGQLGSTQNEKKNFEDALRIRRELFGEKHPDVAASFNNVGSAFGELGDYKKQLEYSEKALEIRRDLFGEKHPDVATSLNHLGGAFGRLGDYKKQLEYSEKALEINRDLFGEKHPDVAASLNNMGGAFGDLGDYKKQLEYLQKALEINREMLGERHPDVATSLNNVGQAFGKLGDYKKQLEYSLKALEIKRELFGEKHPDVALSLNNVGGTFGNLGDYKKQLEYFKKALEIRRELFGEKHPEIANSLNNVGGAFGDLGDYKKQLEYISSAWEILRELLGEKHPDVLLIRFNLAGVHFEMGDRLSASRIVEALMRDVPKELPLRSNVEGFRKMLSAEAVQKGFRQQSVNPGKRKKKKKR